MNRRVVWFLFAVALVMSANAHKPEMHQHITREAFKLLQESFPEQLDEMQEYLGGHEGDHEWSYGHYTICSGARMEDVYDIVYHYGIGKLPQYDQWVSIPSFLIDLVGRDYEAYTCITHFWNADFGENATTALNDVASNVGWSFTIPENAFKKVKKLSTGNYECRFASDPRVYRSWPLGCGNLWSFAIDWQISSPFEMREANPAIRCPIIRFLSNGLEWVDATGSCFTMPFGKGYAYESLGRMCHLLQDMSVPEHVQNVSHGCQNGMRCSVYEDNEMSFHWWTAKEIWDNGKKYINPYFKSTEDDPLYHLMYCLNQITDHYASVGADGDDFYDNQYYLITRNVRHIESPQKKEEVTAGTCNQMNDVLQPLAIRFTAGLMYWFGVEAGMLPKLPSNDNSVGIEPIVNLLLLD